MSSSRARLASLFGTTLLLSGCPKITDPPLTKGLTGFTAPDSLLADGASTALVTADIDSLATSSTRAVTFSTTDGVFLPGAAQSATITADTSGVATTLLRAPRDTGSALITAAFASNDRTAQVHFILAIPQRIDVTPAAFAVGAGPNNQLAVTATLRRTFGVPSLNFQVIFLALDTTNVSRGEFTPAAPSDSTGKTSVSFTPKDTLYHGPIALTALVVIGADTVRGQTTIQITH